MLARTQHPRHDASSRSRRSVRETAAYPLSYGASVSAAPLGRRRPCYASPAARRPPSLCPDRVRLPEVLGEAAARWYSEASGLSAICLRIGTVNAEDPPREPRHFATLLTHAGLLRLVECALEGPADLRFGVYYGVSRNTWRFWGHLRCGFRDRLRPAGYRE